jgi:phosphoglycolate phosphatase-like HAD superfamily hydrolase
VFDPALKWLSKHHIEAREVLYVADGLHDMTAARGVGFNFLGVETGLITHAKFLEHQVKSVSNISDVVDAIK